MPTGFVKCFRKRNEFGFITCEDGREVFVHRSEILGKCKQLEKGTLVEFEVVLVTRGWNARRVRRIVPIEPHQMY